jgi:hypothetical protein
MAMFHAYGPCFIFNCLKTFFDVLLFVVCGSFLFVLWCKVYGSWVMVDGLWVVVHGL